MRLNFNDTLARTLRRIQRQERQEHRDDQPTTSSAVASTNTFQESGYRYNHFEPDVSIDRSSFLITVQYTCRSFNYR